MAEPQRTGMAELHERFAAVARERMAASGWIFEEDADTAPDRPLIAVFRRPPVGELMVTASFVRDHRHRVSMRGLFDAQADAEPLPLVARAIVGVRQLAADRLLELLGESPACAIEREVGALLDPPRDTPVQIAQPAEIPAAVERLASLPAAAGT